MSLSELKLSLSELKRRLFGPEQTPLNPSGTPADGGASVVVESQRRRTFMGVGIVALCFVVVFTLGVHLQTGASSAAPSAPAKRDVHTSETTTAESFMKALKNTELPQVFGAPAEGTSEGDKERAKLALEAWERQHGSAASPYGQGTPNSTGQTTVSPAVAEDPIAAEEKKQRLEQKKHEYASLFSSPVIPVGAVQSEKPPSEPVAAEDAAPSKDEDKINPRLVVNPRSNPGKGENSADCVDLAGADNETRYCVSEGTIIPARLTTRAIGDLAGPVNAVVARDVYSRDRQHVLIPAGTELLGKAHELTSAWQERLSMTFHRMLLPDGRSIGLEEGLGLDQYGSMGVRDKVNRHIGGKIATVLTLGALSTLAGAGTSAGYNTSYNDIYRQNVSQQAAQVGQQMIGRQLSRPNSLTIEEGKVYDLRLSEDIYLLEWRSR